MSNDVIRPKDDAHHDARHGDSGHDDNHHDGTRHDARLFQIGDRVVRKDSPEQGIVVGSNGYTKVKWDGGRTSYFRHDVAANMKHVP